GGRVEVAEGPARGGRRALCPGAAIVVPAHRAHRRDRPEPGQDVGRADVAGVDDTIDAAKRGERLGPHEAVGVRDDADVPALHHAGVNAGSQRGWPLASSVTRSGARCTRWPIRSRAGSAATRIEKMRCPSTLTIAKTRGPSKPADKPVSWTVKPWTIPSPESSVHVNTSLPHSGQKTRGGHAVLPHPPQRVVASLPAPSRA